MNNIIEPDETFDFTKLSLAKPIYVSGSYFTKLQHREKPLYIQTTKSMTKQGFVKSGGKIYCDLMFDKYSEKIINWFEQLEQSCQRLIFEKNNDWFENTLEEDDLNSSFSSIIRVYKSGNYYLIRCSVKQDHLATPCIQIYDEKENKLTINDLTNDMNIVSILEIKGIKFTKRNFIVEIEIKQMMILLDNEQLLVNNCDSDSLFDNCQIRNLKKDLKKDLEKVIIHSSLNNTKIKEEEKKEKEEKEDEEKDEEKDDEEKDEEKDDEEKDEEKDEELIIKPSQETISEPFHLDIEELNDNVFNEPIEINDVDFDTNELETEPFQLKKHDQVYFDLYKEARNKAKIAKKNAILAFLEAKNIKKTYMIANIQDEDEDIDEEIEEASESDLEAFD
jgi:hypothetical protein